MEKKDKPLDTEALVQRMIENREKRLAKRPWPDMHFRVRKGAIVALLGPRGGRRGQYTTPEDFFFHLEQVVKVATGPRGAEIIFESSPPWENSVVSMTDVTIAAPSEFDTFVEQRTRSRDQAR
jgi:hypothetical protein